VDSDDPDARLARLAGADEFVDALAELSFVIQGVLTRTGAKHDLSLTQLRLLGILRDRQPSMQQLAHRLGLDKSSVTGLIDRAERRGMVRRETDPADGRGVRVVITDLGRELATQGAAEIRDALTVVTAPLSPAQRAALVSTARMVVETARAVDDTPSPPPG
jgi:DNA-binding MarR family transcriptional regulator